MLALLSMLMNHELHRQSITSTIRKSNFVHAQVRLPSCSCASAAAGTAEKRRPALPLQHQGKGSVEKLRELQLDLDFFIISLACK